MARNHYDAFSDFCLTGKNSKHGALVMRGDTVWSYDLTIAWINRQTKTVVFNDAKVSKTTSAHQRAITMAFPISLTAKGWTLVNSRNDLAA